MAQRLKLKVPVRLEESRELGTCTVERRNNVFADVLWDEERRHASDVLNMPLDSFRVSAVHIEAGLLHREAAATEPLRNFKKRKVEIAVAMDSSTPLWLQEQRRYQKKLDDLEQANIEQRQLNTELLERMSNLEQRRDRLARRCLLDKARRKVNGGEKLTSQEKEDWDARVDNMPAPELARLGITRTVLQLTKYARNNMQQDGNKEAHKFSPTEVAVAVTQAGLPKAKAFKGLYKFVYGAEAEDEAFA